MRDLARYLGLPERQAAFAALGHSLRTGKPAFDHVHGIDWWSFCADRPDTSTLYQEAMGAVACTVTAVSVNAYDLSGVRRLVDVGAGHGHLTAELLRRYPELTAVVFDLPDVVDGAGAVLGRAGVADRAERVGGDFFVDVPGGGEVYLLSWTLHDWDDADAVRILRNVRRAMPAGARLVVIDEVLPEGDLPHFGKFDDIVMLSLVDGHARTEAEFRELFTDAGLRFEANRPTAAPGNVIVATAS
jgi:SAM-dependent methyltransferase